MSSNSLTTNELKRDVKSGQRISAQDVSVLGQMESGGPTQEAAQTFATHQATFDGKLDELVEKPRSHITQEDARQLEELEVRAIAGRNEALSLPPDAMSDAAYVTKEDASDAQHEEARIYGGQNPRGGMAAQMQSAADKLERARRGS
ncbi:hypothetical protein BJY04DRAFT_214519 [Aspergillus karnatakaensis]|uniref:uncharacterized protein n=1 Tax=Aspergillus karnatakaensis TaxID=1810916 RepID=UPI003CCDAFAD